MTEYVYVVISFVYEDSQIEGVYRGYGDALDSVPDCYDKSFSSPKSPPVKEIFCGDYKHAGYSIERHELK